MIIDSASACTVTGCKSGYCRPTQESQHMKQCQNAQPGTYGHECGQPAQWTATNKNGHNAAFCDQCKQHGHEARTYSQWTPQEPQQ